MGMLDRLIRGSSRVGISRGRPTYIPYSTQPRYKGSYPFGSPGRIDLINANAGPYPLWWGLALRQNPLPLAKSSLNLYQDRRLWAPAQKPVSVVESYPLMAEIQPKAHTDKDWEKYWNRPAYKPRVPSGGIDWRPRVLNQFAIAPWRYGFANPSKVIICLKRKIRKEIMHALGLSGKTGQKRPVFNEYSHIRC